MTIKATTTRTDQTISTLFLAGNLNTIVGVSRFLIPGNSAQLYLLTCRYCDQDPNDLCNFSIKMQHFVIVMLSLHARKHVFRCLRIKKEDPRSLVSAYKIHLKESIIARLATSEISIF